MHARSRGGRLSVVVAIMLGVHKSYEGLDGDELLDRTRHIDDHRVGVGDDAGIEFGRSDGDRCRREHEHGRIAR